jgi:hypothetical protein
MVLFVLSAVVDIDMWNRDGQTTDSDTETERDRRHGQRVIKIEKRGAQVEGGRCADVN